MVQPVFQSPLERQLLRLLRGLQPLLMLHLSLGSLQVSPLATAERFTDTLRRCLLLLHCGDLGLRVSSLLIDVIPEQFLELSGTAFQCVQLGYETHSLLEVSRCGPCPGPCAGPCSGPCPGPCPGPCSGRVRPV